MDTHPLTDLELARRLERTEASANASFVESRARLEPGTGAAWIDVAGVYAMFDGPESPLTQTFGLGLFEPVGEAEFARIESFFRERGAPTFHEVSPMIEPAVLSMLNDRGYRPVEFSSVLVRPTGPEPARAAGPIVARRIDASEADLWSDVAAAGWSSESADLAAVIRGFGRVISGASGAHPFLAFLEGEPVAAATLALHGATALLAGASTIPGHRERGAQRALLDARLHFAHASGATLAMMVAQPGSGSHRNGERHGFRVAYTRTKWQLHDRSGR